MLPLRDANPSSRFPFVTVGLIVINVLFFLYEVFFTTIDQAAIQMGFIPFQMTNAFSGAVAVNIFTSMFLHGGVLHLGGNMLYLWIFGDNIEDIMGPLRFIMFYLLAGIAATLAQYAISPNSQIPLIGASGAIAGVLGAYLLRFPKARVLTLITLGWPRVIEINALWVLGFWFVLQLFTGTLSLGSTGGGVAYFAHIGGFVAGVLLVMLFAPGKRQSLQR